MESEGLTFDEDVTLDSSEGVELVMGGLGEMCDAETWCGVRLAPDLEKKVATAMLFSSAAWFLNCFTDCKRCTNQNYSVCCLAVCIHVAGYPSQ